MPTAGFAQSDQCLVEFQDANGVPLADDGTVAFIATLTTGVGPGGAPIVAASAASQAAWICGHAL